MVLLLSCRFHSSLLTPCKLSSYSGSNNSNSIFVTFSLSSRILYLFRLRVVMHVSPVSPLLLLLELCKLRNARPRQNVLNDMPSTR